MDSFTVVRAAIPDASEQLCDHILWGRTPFPVCVPSVRGLYAAASRFQRAANNGKQLCDFCDRIVVSGWLCAPCRTAISPAASGS